MHRDSCHFHLAEFREHRPDTLCGRPTDRARDHDDLRAIDLTLDDVA